MATKYEILQGKTKWFKYDRLNEWGRWSHVLYLDSPSVEKVRALQEGYPSVTGIKNKLSKDEDGYFMNIGRPSTVKRRGRDEPLTPPYIFEADGTTPYTGLVGNGSDVTTKIEIFDYQPPGVKGNKSLAIRWFSSKIDNLITYEGPRDNDPQLEKGSRGLPEAPPQIGW